MGKPPHIIDAGRYSQLKIYSIVLHFGYGKDAEERKYMNDRMDLCAFNLTPKFGVCNDVKLDNNSVRKIVWLVPHVIKHDMHVDIITWRCNWGNVCKSACIYAMSKEQNKRITDAKEIIRKRDLTLACD
jgi:hypothetical protein